MQIVRRRGVALTALVLTAGAAVLETPAASGQLSGLPVVRGPVPLVESHGRLPWRLTGLVQRRREPLPGAPQRTEELPCLVLRQGGVRETRCLDGEPLLWRRLDGDTGVLGEGLGPSRRRHLLWGFAKSPAAALDVVLGNGRRVRVALRRLPAKLRTDARWFAWAPRPDDAIRRVTLRNGRGQVLARLPEPLPPAGVRGLHGIILDVPGPPAGSATVAAGPLPGDPQARLLVRRVGARLCAEIARPNLEEPACGPPPRITDESLIAARGTALGDTVGGIVPADVAQVVLRPAIGGSPVRLPTQPAGAAAGPAGELLRVFLGQLPYSGLLDVRLLDAAGSTLGHTSVFAAYETSDAVEEATRPLKRGRAPGGERFVLRGDPTGLCLSLTAPGRVRADRGGSTCGLDELELLVPCRPRLAAVLSPGAGRAALRVLSSSGSVFRGSVVRLPRRGRAWLVAVPASERPRAVVWRDRRGRSKRFSLGRVPPPARQCGYTAAVMTG